MNSLPQNISKAVTVLTERGKSGREMRGYGERENVRIFSLERRKEE